MVQFSQDLNMDLPYGHIWSLSVQGGEDNDYDAKIYDVNGVKIAEDLTPGEDVLCDFPSNGTSPYLIKITSEGEVVGDSNVAVKVVYKQAIPIEQMPKSVDLTNGLIGSMDTETQKAIVAAHNRARQTEFRELSPLTYSLTLSAIAQDWARQLVENGFELKHNSQRGINIGENIYYSMGRNTTPSDVVNAWMSEKSNYNWETLTNKPGTVSGHYTQIIWATTTQVGCGMCKTDDGREVWVCNYYPAGNIVGRSPYLKVNGYNETQANNGESLAALGSR